MTHELPASLQIDSSDKHVFTSLELFAGAGGLALGIHAAGFRHLGVVEWDAFAVETLRENSRRVLEVEPGLVIHSDACRVDYTIFANKVDLLAGGPPCQPFSTGGMNLGPEDPRNMFPVFADAVATILPRAILIENVKGLLRAKFADYRAYLLRRFQLPLCLPRPDENWRDHFRRLQALSPDDFAEQEQYVVSLQLVDTADYGIPQRRERVIITAFRKDLGLQPVQLPPTHSREALLIDQWGTGTYWERHQLPLSAYLGPLGKQGTDVIAVPQRLYDSRLPWRTVRDALRDLPSPVERGTDPEILNHVQHPGARIYKGHVGSYFDYPAKALKAGTHGTPGGENVLRISADGSDVRYFTTREAARLQTFPDEWHFHGTWGACIKQLGNAVPVELAKLFATEIRQRLSSVLVSKNREQPYEQTNSRYYASSENLISSRGDRI